MTDYPFQKVGTDLFQWENSEYILVVDYYSRYFEVQKLANMKSVTVINQIRAYSLVTEYPKLSCRIIRRAIRRVNSLHSVTNGTSVTSQILRKIRPPTAWPRKQSKLSNAFSQNAKPTVANHCSEY